MEKDPIIEALKNLGVASMPCNLGQGSGNEGPEGPQTAIQLRREPTRCGTRVGDGRSRAILNSANRESIGYKKWLRVTSEEEIKVAESNFRGGDELNVGAARTACRPGWMWEGGEVAITRSLPKALRVEALCPGKPGFGMEGRKARLPP